MEREDIFNIVKDKMQNIKRKRLRPDSIIVSQEIYQDIYSGSYKSDGSDPFLPDFTQFNKIRYDKLYGLKLAKINTNDEDFIEVYTKG